MHWELRSTALLAGVLLACAPPSAWATAISFSDSQTKALDGSGTFQVGINNGGNIGGPQNMEWGGAEPSFASSYSFQLDYTLPLGVSINSATLNLAALAPDLFPQAVASSTPNQLGAYVPTPLIVNSSAGYLTVSAGSVTADVSGTGALDLLAAGFLPELESGTPLQIAWSQTFGLGADTSGWSKDTTYSNKHQTYTISGTATTAAQATLLIDYSASVHPWPADTSNPEPSTWMLGLGALALVLLRRRRA
jgi:MYXO-CTERM domain-containing protein